MYSEKLIVQIVAFALAITSCAHPSAHAQELNYYDNLSFAHPDEILKLDAGVYQSLPGVYQVHTSGTYKVQCPASIEVDFEKLKAKTAEFRREHQIPHSVSDVYVQWQQVAVDPYQYLKPSAKVAIFESTESDLGFGSCYAIDRSGILLTNRHVVENEKESSMKGDSIMPFRLRPFADLFTSLTNKLGPWEGKGPESDFVLSAFVKWFAEHAQCSSQITSVKIAVAYSKKNWLEQSTTQVSDSIASEAFGFDTRQPVLIPAKVVAKGGEGYANDVAILKIDGVAGDSLICLNLARPEDVREQLGVYTLGFPGYQYNFTDLKPRDNMSVTVQGGKVVRVPRSGNLGLKDRLKMRLLDIASTEDKAGAEDLLFVSARMSFGSSGGPVILADGKVAGMSAAGRHLPPENDQRNSYDPIAKPLTADVSKTLRDANSDYLDHHRRNQNLAVPLERIEAFLQEHKIVPDAGPTTQDWREALADYRNGDYANAAVKLQRLADRQVYRSGTSKPYAAAQEPPKQITSHYVAELLDLARAKAAN